MRAPRFWRDDGVAARLLSPLGSIYGAVARARLARKPPHAPLPAIVVGGLTAGGDGKTLLAIALARRLTALGERPALLTRGYGRKRKNPTPLLVDLALHNADDVGDEALLLARVATTIVGVDRLASAMRAQQLGATILVLDDGFQSAHLTPDLAILAIDADYGAGNGRCLPAGPLRAPLDAQFAAADALVLIGTGARGAALGRRAKKLIATAHVAVDDDAFKNMRVVAFAGMARPEKFFRSLREAGADIVAARPFRDHHRFNARELAQLAMLRETFGARLVTSEKDAARLGEAMQQYAIHALPAALVFDNQASLDALLLLTPAWPPSGLSPAS